MPFSSGLWFIAGTGTDVGKTVVTAGLLRALRENGVDCQAVKAVQTGCVRLPDGSFSAPDVEVYGCASPGAVVHAPFCFTEPCSPHLAAEIDGRALSVAAVCDAVRTLAARAEVTLIEGAGGLLVPVDSDGVVADIAGELGARIILVAPNRLGAINEVLLSLEVASVRGLSVAALVVSTPCSPGSDAGIEAAIHRDNIHILRRKVAPLPVITLDHISGLFDPDADARTSAWTEVSRSLEPIAGVIAASENTGCTDNFTEDLECDSRHLWHPYAPTHPSPPIWHVASTAGNRIRLSDGRELIDGMSSWWSAIHGYNHPRLLATLHRQAERMPHVMFGGLTHRPAVALAKKLVDMTPSGLERVFFADSGSVAVEVAMKMAVQYQHARGRTTRTRFVAPRSGYHGDTIGAMSVCDPVAGMHGLFTGMVAEQFFVGRPSCRFDSEFDPSSIREIEDLFARKEHEIAAFIVEPIVQATGGMWFYHPEYLHAVRRLCDEYGVVLIFDEIATGFGKTGTLFACEWAETAPDILCLGKALTGGVMTLSAVVARDAIAETISSRGVFMHGPTFMANPLACAVAHASLDLLAEMDWQGEVKRLEAALLRGLEPCRRLPGVADVRVLGGIGAVEMERPVNMARLQPYLVEQGVWVRPFANLLYLMPPYVTSDDDVQFLAGAVFRAIEEGKWL